MTIEAGSLGSPPTSALGAGSSHSTSDRSTSGSAGSELGAPSPVGIGRRLRLSSAVRQTLVAMR